MVNAFAPAKLCQLSLKNRFLKAPTFEGMSQAVFRGSSFLTFIKILLLVEL